MRWIIRGLITLSVVMLMASCNDKPTIQQAYDFSLSSWYLQKSIKNGEEVEIRFYLNRQGDFKDTRYNIGYVQMDGSGRVYQTDRRILINREEHELDAITGLDKSNPGKWVYTLFYRPYTDKKTELSFFVIDNFGNQREYLVSFNPDTSKEE